MKELTLPCSFLIGWSSFLLLTHVKGYRLSLYKAGKATWKQLNYESKNRKHILHFKITELLLCFSSSKKVSHSNFQMSFKTFFLNLKKKKKSQQNSVSLSYLIYPISSLLMYINVHYFIWSYKFMLEKVTAP